MLATVLLSCARLAVPAPCSGVSSPAAARELSAAEDKIKAYPDLNLKLDLSAFDAIAVNERKQAATSRGDWRAKLGASEVSITFNVLDALEYNLGEPEDVVEMWRDSMLDRDDKEGESKTTDFAFDPIRTLTGPFGASPFLALARASAKSKERPDQKSLRYILGGMTMDKGWSLRLLIAPPPEKEQLAALEASFEKIAHYDGKPREPKWTDAEAQSFWKAMAPESTQKTYAKPVRSEHFIILSDFPSASQFAKKLEAHYAAVKKVLPFDEQKGRRLLPVLLFRTEDEYQLYYTDRKKLDPKLDVAMTGNASGPLYATSFDNDDEEDQLIDVSKQLMVNRVRCWGGGFWFRSGMRWYIGCKPATLAETRGLVKKNRATALDVLLDDARWGEKPPKRKGSATEQADFWEQSALWMEFLNASPAFKGKFPELVRAMSSVPMGDGEKTKAVLESIYGMPIAALQTKWVEYCSKK